jgi:hypothetical protein
VIQDRGRRFNLPRVGATQQSPHWSSRLLAAELGVSHSTVARVWAEHDIRP